MNKLRLAPKFLMLLFILLIVAGCDDKHEEMPAVVPPTQLKVAQAKPKVVPTKPAVKPVSKIKVTFIELGSIKCAPCRMMQPIIDEIAKEYEGQVQVVYHDVWTDAGQPFAKKYRVQAIPTQIFLDKNGEEFYRHVGFFPKDELIKVLRLKGVE